MTVNKPKGELKENVPKKKGGPKEKFQEGVLQEEFVEKFQSALVDKISRKFLLLFMISVSWQKF